MNKNRGLYTTLAALGERLRQDLIAPNIREPYMEKTAREMYDLLKEHFEQPPTPPPLGVTVSETVNSEDHFG